VGYPPDLDDVGHVFTTDAGYKDGPAVQFLFRILEQSNFSITVANFSTSEASLERYSPSNGYTACVHDVSLGYVDMCVGTFLLTKERRILSHFTGNTFESTQLLIVLREPSNRKSIGDLLRTPLKAFTNEAWLLMSFSVFYMAFVLFSIRETYDGKYNPMNKRRSVVTARATKSLYHGILSLTSGTVSGKPTAPKLSERIVIAGFAIFGLFFLTAYQASFTVTLISNEIRGQFGSVDEVLAADLKVRVVVYGFLYCGV